MALIEHVSAVEARTAITGGSQRALHAAWLAVEGEGDPLDIDRLVSTLAHGNMNQAAERIARLSKRLPDPRVAAALEALIASPPSAAFVKSASTHLWDAVFAELARIADPRTKMIGERIPWLVDDRADSPFDVGRNRARTARAIAKLAAAIEPALELSAEQRTQIDVFGKRARAIARPVDRGAELLARIYDAPHDLDARAVYADWLTSNGDPRGEFIALQLAHREIERPWGYYSSNYRASTREKALLRTHINAWLGRFGALVGYPQFRRGFLAHGRLETEVALRSLAMPEAATLEHLGINRDDFETGRLLAARPFHGLTSVGVMHWKTLAGLLDKPGTTVRVVAVSASDVLPVNPDCLHRDVALEQIHLQTGDSSALQPSAAVIRAFMKTPVVQRLRVLRIESTVHNEAAFVDAFAESTIGRLEIGIWSHIVELAIVRDGGGLTLHVTVGYDKHPPNRKVKLDRARGLPIDKVVLQLDPQYAKHPDECEKIAEAAQALTRGPVELR